LKTTVKQTIHVPSEKVFNAWAFAGELSKWFTTNAVQDFKVGGNYSNGDGDSGTFLEIIPGKLIRFSWENKNHCPGTEVTIELSELSPGITELKISHENLSNDEHINGMNKGWSWAVYSLKSYLETGKPVSYETWEKQYN
jgi:uncharacterized protein YndB with AHSA1/START domain